MKRRSLALVTALLAAGCKPSPTVTYVMPLPGQPQPIAHAYYRCPTSYPDPNDTTCMKNLARIQAGRAAEAFADFDHFLERNWNAEVAWDAGLVDPLRGEWWAGVVKLAEARHFSEALNPHDRTLGPEIDQVLARYLALAQKSPPGGRSRLDVTGPAWDGSFPMKCGSGTRIRAEHLDFHPVSSPTFAVSDGCTLELDQVHTHNGMNELFHSAGAAKIAVRGGKLQRRMIVGGKTAASFTGADVSAAASPWMTVTDDATVELRDPVLGHPTLEIRGHGTLNGSGSGWAHAHVHCTEDATVILDGVSIGLPAPEKTSEQPGVNANGRCKVILRNVTIRNPKGVAVVALGHARVTIEGGVVESGDRALHTNDDGVIEAHGTRVSGKIDRAGHSTITTN